MIRVQPLPHNQVSLTFTPALWEMFSCSVQELTLYRLHLDPDDHRHSVALGWVTSMNMVNFREREFKLSRFLTSSLIQQICVSPDHVTGLGIQQGTK